jgi:hypothetical protein
VATVKYHIVKDDIGKTLAIKVNAPANATYIHCVQAAMDEPVGKLKQGAVVAEVISDRTTKNTIVVKYIEGAEYAIVKTDEEATATLTYENKEENIIDLTADANVDDAKTDSSESDTTDLNTIGKDADGNASGNQSGGVTTDENGNVIIPSAIDEEGDDSATDNQQTDNTDQSGTTDQSGDTEQSTGSDGEKTDETTETETAKGYQFTGLDPKTEYTVYVRLAETDTKCASETAKTSATTKKIGYNDPDDETGEKLNQDASVTIEGALKVDETLKAVIDDPNTPKVFVTAEDAAADETGETKATVDYQWYRVKDGVETAIADATGASYTLTEADLGYQIKIVVSLNENSEYDGEITYTTDATDLVKVKGVKITGTVVTYNAKKAVYYELYLKGADGQYSTTPIASGIAVAAADTTTPDQQTQTFVIENVPDTAENTSYKLVIKKDIHLTYTIEGITVSGEDVDLSTKAWKRAGESDDDAIQGVITMAVGDLDGNGAVNSSDLALLSDESTYNLSDTEAEYAQADIDGNASINSGDMSILVSEENYNMQSTQYVFTIK